MYIQVNINLNENQSLAYSPDAAAAQVIAALGGNPTIDFCEVHIVAASEPGTAGTPQEPPPGPSNP